jgi:hypothetical protein
MSTYELKVLVSRMEEKETDRFRRRRGGHHNRERSHTTSNDGQPPETHIAVPTGLLDDDREGRFFDEMCGTLRTMLQKAIAERDARNEDDEDDELEHEREVEDDDEDDEDDRDCSADGTKKSKKGGRRKKKKGKRIGSLLHILSSKGRDGKRKAKEGGDDAADGHNSDESPEPGDAAEQMHTGRGSRIMGLGKKAKKSGSSKKERKKEKRAAKERKKGSKLQQRKEGRDSSDDDAGSSGSGRKGSGNKIASMLPFPLSLSRSKLPADLDQAGVLARPAIFDDSLFEGWLYRRKEKGMRKTWQKVLLALLLFDLLSSSLSC